LVFKVDQIHISDFSRKISFLIDVYIEYLKKGRDPYKQNFEKSTGQAYNGQFTQRSLTCS